jgi:hypothetical protein
LPSGAPVLRDGIEETKAEAPRLGFDPVIRRPELHSPINDSHLNYLRSNDYLESNRLVGLQVGVMDPVCDQLADEHDEIGESRLAECPSQRHQRGPCPSRSFRGREQPFRHIWRAGIPRFAVEHALMGCQLAVAFQRSSYSLV